MQSGLLLSITAAAAVFSAAPAGAQGYGLEQYCHFVGGALRCESRTVSPRGYMGDKKWCLYRDGTLGNTALCSYASFRDCLTGKLNGNGRCTINPDYAEGIAPAASARRDDDVRR